MPSSLISSIAAILLISTLTSAQTGTILDHSRLPDCAFQCPTLLGAQASCVPPSAPQADQGTYQTCFCNSNPLAPFRAGGTAGVCDGTCQQNDLVQIQQWFQGLCTGGVVVIPNGGDAATSTSSGLSSTGQASSPSPSSRGPTWYAITPILQPNFYNVLMFMFNRIQQQYRWVIMIIILLLAAGIGIFLGLWLKRRSAKRKELKHRDSMLARSDTVNVLRNPHPDAPSSITQMPRFSSNGSVAANAAVARAGMGGSGRVDSVKGKSRASSGVLQEGVVDGSPGPSNSRLESNRPGETRRLSSSTLKKSNSNRGR
jgi:hypothetical protein